jgi:hypothetical protein
VIITTALVGLHALLQQALQAEATASVAWTDYAAADAVADHLCDVLQQAFSLPNVDALIADSDPEGASRLTCVACNSSDPLNAGAVQRCRYRWNFPAGDARAGTIQLQRLYYAGTKNISTIASVDESSDEATWARAEPTTIAQNLSALSIHFRPLDGEAESVAWKGPSGNVLIRIHVKVAQHEVERIVQPAVNTAMFETQKPGS